ncbi:MAG: LAGLIDADG family homing endonuclease [Candidatus Paceibacterota bacterium]|jgi:intein/homing endonuclease
MVKRGSKPQGKVKIEWSPEFAYAIGLLVADGCLSKDGRHIDLTSKDKDQIVLFHKCLGLTTKISGKNSGVGNVAYHTQFGDVLFYRFLESIGLTPAKSKTISSMSIPRKYFQDFLRGYFDGDGSSYSYFDPVYEKSFRFYISFTSASPKFFDWLRVELSNSLGIKGSLSYSRNNPYVQLKFSKKEAIILAEGMYYLENLPCLRRKYLKIMESMRIINAIKKK